MRILRRTVMAIGGMTVVVLIIALAAPKAAHGVVATLVQVVNDTAHPVPVSNGTDGNGNKLALLGHDADNPAVQPFEFYSIGRSGGNPLNLTVADVPTGKRLVIEFVSAMCLLPQPVIGDLRLFTTNNIASVQYTFAPQPVGTGFEVIWTQQTRIYADPGTTVTMSNGAVLPDNSNCSAAVSGYFVNTP